MRNLYYCKHVTGCKLGMWVRSDKTSFVSMSCFCSVWNSCKWTGKLNAALHDQLKSSVLSPPLPGLRVLLPFFAQHVADNLSCVDFYIKKSLLGSRKSDNSYGKLRDMDTKFYLPFSVKSCICSSNYQYSRTSLIWTPKGRERASVLWRCPYYRGGVCMNFGPFRTKWIVRCSYKGLYKVKFDCILVEKDISLPWTHAS